MYILIFILLILIVYISLKININKIKQNKKIEMFNEEQYNTISDNSLNKILQEKGLGLSKDDATNIINNEMDFYKKKTQLNHNLIDTKLENSDKKIHNEKDKVKSIIKDDYNNKHILKTKNFNGITYDNNNNLSFSRNVNIDNNNLKLKNKKIINGNDSPQTSCKGCARSRSSRCTLASAVGSMADCASYEVLRLGSKAMVLG